MTAAVIIMPVVPRRTLGDPAWREQYERECAAKAGAMLAPPPRTRPLLVISSPARGAGPSWKLVPDMLQTLDGNCREPAFCGEATSSCQSTGDRLIALASEIRHDVKAQFDLDMAELQQAFVDNEGGC